MKKKLSTFLAIMLCLSIFAGCDKQDTTGNNGINTEYEGIYLTLMSSKIEEDAFGKEYTSFNLRLHNETDKNGEYDASYEIEYKDGETWRSVLNADIAWDAVLYMVLPNGAANIGANTRGFDVSREGIYRILLDFSVDGTTYNTWVEFGVKDNEYDVLSKFLDRENFVAGVSQGDLIDQLGKYKYEGEKITDVVEFLYYDSESGGGVSARGDLFGYRNDFSQTDEATTYTNLFWTQTDLEGLTLPYHIDFGDSLSDVFQKMEIGINPYNGFRADTDSKTKMTLYSNGTATLVFKDLKRTDEPIEVERPYELIYCETTSRTRSDGKVKTVERTIIFSFVDKDRSEDDSLWQVEMSVVEKY